MCKHILNAQVAIRAQCCKKWVDCAECHAEIADHELLKTPEMVFACKKCKKVFRKDLGEFEESDEYCPRCDNHFYISADTPEDKGRLVLEIEAKEGHENDLIRDDRVKQRNAPGTYGGMIGM
eukprot:CAMPEP_0114996564 /NCGR_PEP_ID=MMETSP0216-20121206/14392_1 /TAXON_ID=223996 /ORGANISM="Protocruzia adherens, Strain Boccale" /LENGTH=121 /DNA_ID=CAMNT_0002360805 /DNA_START=198 /DNA_END=563 /DNA_ORIENTATION=+